MDKFEGYKYLSKINRDYNVDISEQVKNIAGKKEVPQSVISFINKYIPRDSTTTLNMIYEKRHKNPLYKSLVNEDSKIEDKAIALSSYLTQAMIGLSKITDESSKSMYCEDLMINDIINSLAKYSCGDSSMLSETFSKVRRSIKSIKE